MFLLSCTYKCGDITTSCRRPVAAVAPVAPPPGLVPAPAPDPAPSRAEHRSTSAEITGSMASTWSRGAGRHEAAADTQYIAIKLMWRHGM